MTSENGHQNFLAAHHSGLPSGQADRLRHHRPLRQRFRDCRRYCSASRRHRRRRRQLENAEIVGSPTLEFLVCAAIKSLMSK